MSTSKQVARAVADVTGGTIIATVEIAAPPERVFAAISTDEITKWWGSPATYQTTEWTAELRVGGRWRSRGRSADSGSRASSSRSRRHTSSCTRGRRRGTETA